MQVEEFEGMSETQKGVLATVKQEIVQAALPWATQHGDLDLLERLVTQPGIPLPEDLLEHCWPYARPGTTSRLPPSAQLMFLEPIPDLGGRKADRYILQVNRYLCTLQAAERVHRQVHAGGLSAGELAALAERLQLLYGGELRRWIQALPVALDGTAKLVDQALPILEASLRRQCEGTQGLEDLGDMDMYEAFLTNIFRKHDPQASVTERFEHLFYTITPMAQALTHGFEGQ